MKGNTYLKKEIRMLVNSISIILMLAFSYGLVRNFRRGNYSYAFVMYVGAVIFYANLYHNLSGNWGFYLLMLMLFIAIICAISFIYQAIRADDINRHYWGATALSVLSMFSVVLFKFIL